MSGLCGLVRLSAGSGDQELQPALSSMMQAGAHRGVDGTNSRVFDRAALGHLWLNIQRDGADELQPVASEDGKSWIVLDGEIQNADELRKRIESARGKPMSRASFPHLMLEAYTLFGNDFLIHVEGIFAAALWDSEKDQLLCFRDRLGVRSLFYAKWRSCFVFASEIGQILALPGFERRPNEQMIADYLCADTSLREESFFEGISRVPSGICLVVRAGNIARKQYWELDPEYRVELPDDAAYGERFLELLEAATQRNMQSPAALGAALSGGLDSSSIVCLADRIRTRRGESTPMETFSLAFEDKLVDETEHVQAVGAATRINHNQYYADGENLFSHMRAVQLRQAEPFRSLGIVLFWRLKQLSAAKGMRVLLNGMGADEVLGGINLFYLADLLRGGHWGTLRSTLDALVKHDPFALNYTPWQYLKVFALRPLAPASLRLQWRRLRGSQLPRYIDADFGRRAQIEQRIVAKRKPLFPDVYRQISYEGVRHHYTPLLMHYEDTNNAAFGLESRFPFLDRELVEFLFGLPREQKVRDGKAKIVLRNGMRGVLPDSVRNRVDKGFIDRSVDHWLAHQYKDMVESVLWGDSLRRSGWFDMKQLHERYRHYQATHDGRFIVWKSFNLGLWLEEFF